METQSAGPTLHKLRVAIFGSANVGKKTYIQKLGKKQNQNLMAKLQGQGQQSSTSIHLQSNCGPCQVTLVNTQQKANGFDWDNYELTQNDNKIKECDSAILMFSLTDRQSYKDIPLHHRKWTFLTENYNVVLVSTKGDDVENRRIKQKMIVYHRKKNLQFYNICAKAAYNILNPLQFLFRRKFNDPKFSFTNVQNFVDLVRQGQIENLEIIEKQKKQCSSYQLPDFDFDY